MGFWTTEVNNYLITVYHYVIHEVDKALLNKPKINQLIFLSLECVLKLLGVCL